MYKRIAIANGVALAGMLGAIGCYAGLHWDVGAIIVLIVAAVAAFAYLSYAWWQGERWRKRRNKLFRAGASEDT